MHRPLATSAHSRDVMVVWVARRPRRRRGGPLGRSSEREP